MSAAGQSFRKVRYDLRPAKQVERLMLVDAFRRLERSGLPVSDYRYVGMGSVHFYDFVMFHRYLGMKRMTSAEINEEIRKRVSFNKPFHFVTIEMRAIGDVIQDIPPDEKVVLWLDYDDRLERFHLEDLGRAVKRLAPGSIVLLTVDIEPPDKPMVSASAFYRQRLENLVPETWPPQRFGPAAIPKSVTTLVQRAIEKGLSGRIGVSFEPIVQFVYRDGHKMLSLGGIICTQQERHAVMNARLTEECYYRPRFDMDPFEIRVPVLTRRERLYLDRNMPASAKWQPTAFEMDAADLRSYKDIYRFTPLFAELIA